MGNDGARDVANKARWVVVAPTFNHGRRLSDVLTALGPLGMTVIVVDDGSRDETAVILRAWTGNDAARIVLTHAENKGKGAALRTGFAEAERRGFTHAATI